MSDLKNERLEAAHDGLDTDMDPASMGKAHAPVHENFLTDREGVLPMRGPITGHAELSLGTDEIIAGVWSFNDKLLVGLADADATATREPWVAPYRPASSESQLALPELTMKHVALDSLAVTNVVAPSVEPVIGGRGERLGDAVFGYGYARTLSAGPTSSGPRSGGTFASVAGVGGSPEFAWATPANAAASEDTRTTATIVSNGFSEYHKSTNFGFAIPAAATILGIKVEIERSAITAAVQDWRVRIVKGGSVKSSDRANVGVNWPGTDAYQTYGSNSDLWGETWTPANINATDFGVVLAAQGFAGAVARIDHVRITVHYTETPSTDGQFNRRLLRWDGTANAPTMYSNAPEGAQDVAEHLNRLWALGGIDVPAGSTVLESSSLFYTDQGGPTTDTTAKWQDDVSGLTNKIVVDSENPNDFGVALAKVGQNLTIFKRRSLYVLYGYSPTTFTLRTVSSDIGCVDARSIVQYDEGCYFLSEQGYMFFDGTSVRNVSENLRRSLRLAMEGTVGDDGSDGGRAVATKLPNNYLLLSIVDQQFSGGEFLPALSFSAMLHTPTGRWSKFASNALARPIPFAVGRTSTKTWLSDGSKIVLCPYLTSPEVAEVINKAGFDEVTVSAAPVKARIPSKWYSRLLQCDTPPLMGQLHRLLVDYAFGVDGTADDAQSGWFVRLIRGDGTSLLTEYQLPSMGDPSTYLYRRRHVKDVFSEVTDCQVQIEWRDAGGTYPALIKAELYGVTLERQATRQRRSS